MEWKPIPDWPEYEASDAGDIRRAETKRILRPAPWRTGYLQVSLWRNNHGHTHWVHRLVCSAFHGAPEGQMDAAHTNRVKTDNRPENLRWATRAQNENDKRAHGVANIGERNGGSRLNAQLVEQIRQDAWELPTSSGDGMRIKKGAINSLVAKYGITASCIRNIIAYRSWRHIP